MHEEMTGASLAWKFPRASRRGSLDISTLEPRERGVYGRGCYGPRVTPTPLGPAPAKLAADGDSGCRAPVHGGGWRSPPGAAGMAPIHPGGAPRFVRPAATSNSRRPAPQLCVPFFFPTATCANSGGEARACLFRSGDSTIGWWVIWFCRRSSAAGASSTLRGIRRAAAGRAGPTQKRCASWARARSAPLLAPRATTSTRGVTPGLPLVSAAFLLEFYNR